MANLDTTASQQSPLIYPVVEPFQRICPCRILGRRAVVGRPLVALVWANSPWADSYHACWILFVSVAAGSHVLTETLLDWINDGLMAMFFFVIGLEINRDLPVGELASPQQAPLPLFVLANTGVSLDADSGGILDHPVVIGTMLGLVIGKPIAIVEATWMAVRSGAASLPDGASWRQPLGVGCVAGSGLRCRSFSPAWRLIRPTICAPRKWAFSSLHS